MKSKSASNKTRQSVEDVQKALQEARDEIERLRKVQEKAMEAVSKASASLKETETKAAEMNRAYAEKAFWDDRYQQSSKSASSDSPLEGYEWYVSLESMKSQLQRDIGSSLKSMSKAILLPGCGDSLLGEDLARIGYYRVLGVDYSAAVIDSMRSNAKQKSLSVKYAVADVREMIEYMDSSYDAIIDKGTLDAICSGAKDSSASKASLSAEAIESFEGLRDVVRYVCEMWRLLAINGCFIIVSAAPKDILNGLMASKLKLHKCSDWVRCQFEKITTSVGEIVYYYAIKKLDEIEAEVLNELEAEQLNANASSPQGSKGDVVSLFLSEAKKLLENKDNEELQELTSVAPAASRVDSQSQSTLRSSIVESTTVARSDLPVQLNYEINSNANVLEIAIESISAGFAWEDGDIICLRCTCSNRNALLYRLSEQPFEAFEYVDDINCRVAINLPEFGGTFEVVYLSNVKGNTLANSSRYVVRGLSESFVIAVPFYLSHPDRSPASTSSNGKSASCRRRGVAAIAALSSHQRSLTTSSSSASSASLLSSSATAAAKAVAYQLPNAVISKVETRLEYLFGINVVNFNWTLQKDANVKFIASNRFGIWLFPIDSKIDAIDGFHVVIEFDIIFISSTVEAEAKAEPTVSTSYIIATCTDQLMVGNASTADMNINNKAMRLNNIDIGRCQFRVVETDKDSLQYSLRLQLVSATLRLPAYPKLNAFPSSRSDDGQSSSSKQAISCKFCDAELVSQERLQKIELLPTGYFDNMLSEFVCCENLPEDRAMNVADIIPSKATAQLGEIQLSINPMDVRANSLLLKCKQRVSLQDFSFGANAVMLSLSTQASNTNSGSNDSNSRTDRRRLVDLSKLKGVNIETCSILCKRCLSELGDGLIRHDECNVPYCAPTSHNWSATSTRDGVTALVTADPDHLRASDFFETDMRDIRFSLHQIHFNIQTELAERSSISLRSAGMESCIGRVSISAAQALSRVLVQLSVVYSVASFCVYPVSQTWASNSRTRQSSKEGEEETESTSEDALDVVCLKLVGRNCWLADIPTDGSLRWTEGVKVSFAVVPNGDGDKFQLKVKEARVNVSLVETEFREVCEVLQYYAFRFGVSIFANQQISFLPL